MSPFLRMGRGRKTQLRNDADRLEVKMTGALGESWEPGRLGAGRPGAGRPGGGASGAGLPGGVQRKRTSEETVKLSGFPAHDPILLWVKEIKYLVPSSQDK